MADAGMRSLQREAQRRARRAFELSKPTEAWGTRGGGAVEGWPGKRREAARKAKRTRIFGVARCGGRTFALGEGQPLVNVAAVHEYGSRPIVVKLSEKARRFLHAAFRKAGLDRPSGGTATGIAIIKVPARPFLSPVFERYGADAEVVSKRVLDRVARLLAGDFGTGR